MLYELYNLITFLLRYDYYYCVARRAVDVTKMCGFVGAGLIEYGRQNVEVIWPRNSPSHIEEIIKLDPNHFSNNRITL